MEELKHDPYSDAGNSSAVMSDECGWTEQRKAHVEEIMKGEKAEGLQLADDLFRRFGSHERLPELLDLAHEHQGRPWLWALGELWTRFDNISIHADLLFTEVFERATYGVRVISQLMNEEEQAAFDALPEELVIYRGCGTRNEFGFSWSLDREIAAKFPFTRRYQADRPMLLTARIPKSMAAAIKLGRQEQEIIVFDYADEPSFAWTVEHLDTPPDFIQ